MRLTSFLSYTSSSLFSFEKNVWAAIPPLFSLPNPFFPICDLHDIFGINFLHLWGICLFLVSLLYARFELLLMHSNPWCILFIQQPIMLQCWLLYTELIQFSVQLQFSVSLWVILHDQLLIVVSKINLSPSTISTWYQSHCILFLSFKKIVLQVRHQWLGAFYWQSGQIF